MTDQNFFGLTLNKGHPACPLNFVWLEINCNISKPYNRFSYNELRIILFNSFIIYCRNRYQMSPLLYKDMNSDIFISYLNKYIEKEENSKFLIESIQSQKMDLFYDKFIHCIASYFFK